MVIDSLESQLGGIAQVSTEKLNEVNARMRGQTCDKTNEEEIDQADRGNILERLLVGEYGEFLKQDPLQVDSKYFNSLELDFFEKNDWAIQESLFEQMKHDMQKRVEVSHRSEYDHAVRYQRDYLGHIGRLMPLLVGDFKKDEECCLICGDADYEEDNLIGFCDICGLSVHQECYGLAKLDAQTEFKCNNCKAFGEDQKSMLVQCMFCSHRGGAMMPTGILKADYEQFIQLKTQVDHAGSQPLHDLDCSNQYDQLLHRLTNHFEEVMGKEKEHQSKLKQRGPQEDAKIPYVQRLALLKNRLSLESVYAWIHVSCYIWHSCLTTVDSSS